MPRLFLLFILISLSAPASCPSLLLQHRVTLPPAAWRAHLGGVWAEIFARAKVRRTGVVVEVAPGSAEKVGLGLAQFGFQGTLYVVEPHAASLATVTARYRALMPLATIVPIESSLRAAVPKLPRPIDALVANHPLDDMVLAASLSAEEATDIFARVYNAGEEGVARAAWKRLGGAGEAMERAISETVADWEDAGRALSPKVTLLSQYLAYYHATPEMEPAVRAATEALRRLRAVWPAGADLPPSTLRALGQDPAHWFARFGTRDLAADLVAAPEAVAELGPHIFVDVPARPLSSDEYEIVYISRDHFARMGYEGVAAADLAPLAIDLEGDVGAVTALADRQADPQGIALNENGGSGRAVYYGARFNLKGPGRTPLVNRPPHDVHGTGRLAFSSALWEGVCANSLDKALHTGASPVLAIYRLKNKKFIAPWGRNPLVSAAVAVRPDDGALSRPTHLFFGTAGPETPDIARLAARLGEHDAEKFIERIEHGAWSAGNISLGGQMLDMDTVSAVVGRGPAYSLSGWFPATLFGFEGEGYKSMLAALTSDGGPRAAFDEAREARIRRRLLDLFGLPAPTAHRALFARGGRIAELSAEFQRLARYIRPDFMALYTAAADRTPPELFDLSRYLRVFAHLVWKGEQHTWTEWMLTPPSLDVKLNPRVSPEVVERLRAVATVESPLALQQRRKEAAHFARMLSKFFEELASDALLGDGGMVFRRAYVLNEPRNYLSDTFGAATVFKMAEEFEAKKISGDRLQRLMDLLIYANRRSPSEENEDWRADLRLFREGYMVRRLNPFREHRIEVALFEPAENIRISVDGTFRPVTPTDRGNFVTSPSPFDPMAPPTKVAVYSGETRIRFTEWVSDTPPAPFSLEEAP